MKKILTFAPAVLALALLGGCALGPKPGPGDKVPTFTATLDNGQKAPSDTLMGEKGMVLYFYPKDETPGCVDQACTFQEKLLDFEGKGYKVVGVSMDEPAAHQGFKSNRKLTFTLVSDADKAIAKIFNVPTETDPKGSFGFRRTTFVVTKDGIIRKRFEVPEPKEQVNRAYAAINEPF